jgi:hypothetical protein|nr:MAG TPA: hypothetical protein [Caudoviricetes sp.]
MDYYFFFKLFIASLVMTIIFVFVEDSAKNEKQKLVYDALSSIFSGISMISLIVSIWVWVFE